MPFLTRQATDENDTLAAYCAQQIRQVATTLFGLSDQQIRATPTASPMSLASLARHCIYVGNEGLLASAVDPSRLESRGTGNYAAGEPVPEAVSQEDTSDSLMAELEDMATWVEALLPTLDLEARVKVPDAPWYPKDLESWSTRWVILHHIEEFARHAGHADIIRESIDGKIAYELNALADGQSWPPEGWEQEFADWEKKQQ